MAGWLVFLALRRMGSRVLSDHALRPPSPLPQMVEGRLSKFYEDSCLLEQKYLMDDSLKVKAAVDK